MEDFDLFTDEINFTKPYYMNILNKYVKDVPATPHPANYQSGKRLLAEECLAARNETECAFHFSESVSNAVRTMAVYRDEQHQIAGDKLQKITSYTKPIKDLIENTTITKEHKKLLEFLTDDTKTLNDKISKINVEVEPFYKTYLRYGKHNNVDNFLKILGELPKEWTIVQLTAPYNANDNWKPYTQYRTEINSIFLSVFTNDFMDGPITIKVPANVTKEGEKPLFTELYSLLEDNYKTIDNAQFLNNKRLVQNYWSRREDIDLRMKSVINIMDKEWLGGWVCLLAGSLVDSELRARVEKLVDNTIDDWGLIKLTKRQRGLLYNLIGSSPSLSSSQIKSCLRKILTEQMDPTEIRNILNSDCQSCSKEFFHTNELCVQCLSKCFSEVHKFSLVDGIRAFSQTALAVREGVEWSGLKRAKRNPVILIVDEILDTFPWEMLPILNHQPVTRMENIHLTYFLYKVHEKNIDNGYFMVKDGVGRYVVNPEKNLDRMEKRMHSFVQYWCKGWSGVVGEPPKAHEFLKYLEEADIFLYCGHGDGCRFATNTNTPTAASQPASANQPASAGAGVESVRTRSVCVLAGCGSARLLMGGRRQPGSGAHHKLHLAHCPMVIGMLWEVTDLEVDKVISSLLALFVPSTAPISWTSVGKAKWGQGVLDTSVEEKQQLTQERDLLRAVSRARSSTGFTMIASSAVARGLPVAMAI